MLKTLVKFTVKESQSKLLSSPIQAPCRRQQIRYLNVHENQAYTLLKSVGIRTPPFGVAKTPDEAEKIARELDTSDLVVKAQVLAGGRGVGHFQGSNIGGVIMCETPQEVKEVSSKMIGKYLVTKQTGADGKICNSVMVTTRLFSRKELYLSVMLERTFGGPVVIASKRGGVSIEDIAKSDPDAILYMPVDINKGLSSEDAFSIAKSLGVCNESEVSSIVLNLYKLFVSKDALLLEINPLVQDVCNNFIALDCKCNFDESARFRQEELFKLEDLSQKAEQEVIAEKFGLNYISLDGNIACMVNGAGLAMATMDIIKLNGGSPANFLDVSGGATKETVTEAFKIISNEPKIEAVFVNIFGGIVQCDVIARGLIAAFKELDYKLPVIVRLQGTNAEAGRKLITEAKLKMIPIDDLAKAARASVQVAKIMRAAKLLNVDVQITPKPEEVESHKNVEC